MELIILLVVVLLLIFALPRYLKNKPDDEAD